MLSRATGLRVRAIGRVRIGAPRELHLLAIGPAPRDARFAMPDAWHGRANIHYDRIPMSAIPDRDVPVAAVPPAPPPEDLLAPLRRRIERAVLGGAGTLSAHALAELEREAAALAERALSGGAEVLCDLAALAHDASAPPAARDRAAFARAWLRAASTRTPPDGASASRAGDRPFTQVVWRAGSVARAGIGTHAEYHRRCVAARRRRAMPREPAVQLEKIFERLPGRYLILSSSLEIVAVNDAYLEATMRTRDQLLGRYVFDAFPENPDDPAGGVDKLRDSLGFVLTTRQAHTMGVTRYDIPRLGGGLERYWSPINTPVLDEQGEVALIIHRVRTSPSTSGSGSAATRSSRSCSSAARRSSASTGSSARRMPISSSGIGSASACTSASRRRIGSRRPSSRTSATSSGRR